MVSIVKKLEILWSYCVDQMLKIYVLQKYAYVKVSTFFQFSNQILWRHLYLAKVVRKHWHQKNAKVILTDFIKQ